MFYQQSRQQINTYRKYQEYRFIFTCSSITLNLLQTPINSFFMKQYVTCIGYCSAMRSCKTLLSSCHCSYPSAAMEAFRPSEPIPTNNVQNANDGFPNLTNYKVHIKLKFCLLLSYSLLDLKDFYVLLDRKDKEIDCCL